MRRKNATGSGSYENTDPQERYEHFLATGQEKLKLMDALDGYFSGLEPEDHRVSYRDYISRRIRPAALRLAERGEADRLRKLSEEGLMKEDILSELLRQTQDPDRPGIWLQLLRCRETAGAPGGYEKTGRTGDGMMQGIRPLPEIIRTQRNMTAPGGLMIREDARMILRECRNELYRIFPYLDGALAVLRPESREEGQIGAGPEAETMKTVCFSTDGRSLFYRPDMVIRIRREDPSRLRRALLHVLLHCLLGHLWTADSRDPEQMLACDVIAEFLIERECWRSASVRDILGSLPMPGLWSSLYEKLQGGTWSVSRVQKTIQKELGAGQKERMGRLLLADDPSGWQAGLKSSDDNNRELWQRIALDAGEGSSQGKRGLGIGETPGSGGEEIGSIHRGNQDFREYLHRFAVPKEEVELDPDSFDYIYYTLGIERYKNLPLIEPLEYREGHKLEELVIAIDTSGSCKTETVRRFLEEIYAILEEKENFFNHMNVWILQCDCILQDARHITCRADWDDYLRTLTISGRAGTDFSPVFRFAGQLIKDGKLKNLKGLLYFTDGDGAYPREEPPFETAFVFVKETAGMGLVPSWAKILRAY